MATAKLRKENEQLRNEVKEIQGKLDQVTEDLLERNENLTIPETNHAAQSSDKDKSIEFISAQNDDLILFRDNTVKELKHMKQQINNISKKCEDIANFLEQIEDYSYQYNIKIMGIPQQSRDESAKETTKLCLKIFSAIGADVSMQDIDIAHRVPARRQTDRPNAVVCKFVRRLAKEKIMTVRKQTGNVQPEQLGLSSDVELNYLSIYEHLTPRLQNLLFEATKYKKANHFKFCWVKGKTICLRKSENGQVIKLAKLEDLTALYQAS